MNLLQLGKRNLLEKKEIKSNSSIQEYEVWSIQEYEVWSIQEYEV